MRTCTKLEGKLQHSREIARRRYKETHKDLPVWITWATPAVWVVITAVCYIVGA